MDRLVPLKDSRRLSVSQGRGHHAAVSPRMVDVRVIRKYYTSQQESLCVFIQEIGYEKRYILINAQSSGIKLKGDIIEIC